MYNTSIMELIKKAITYFSDTFITLRATPNVSRWKIILLWILRVLTIGVAIHQIFFGHLVLGIVTLICFFILTIPSFFMVGLVKFFPLEVEILLFFMVFIQFVLGEVNGLYYKQPYFDKFVHFIIPFLISILAFLIVYVMYKTGKLKASRLAISLMVLLFAMGIGAIWEVIEYGVEFLRKNYFHNWVTFQGSLVEDAYTDTMNDLVADLIGSLLGIFFSLKYIEYHRGTPRMKEMIQEVKDDILE